jgi:hypothetical protein
VKDLGTCFAKRGLVIVEAKMWDRVSRGDRHCLMRDEGKAYGRRVSSLQAHVLLGIGQRFVEGRLVTSQYTRRFS